MSEFNHHQPDQQGKQPDVTELAWLDMLAAEQRARRLGLPIGAEARLEFLRTMTADKGTLDDIDLLILDEFTHLDEQSLDLDIPLGLPPKLLELWAEEDRRSGIMPPDTAQ